MMTEVLAALLRANIVGGLAILAVLALRAPMRRAFGPELAYGLWSLPPVAFVATLMPPPVLEDKAGVNPLAVALADHSLPTLGVWALGVAVTATLLGWAQLWHLALGAFLLGLAAAIDEPARASFFPRLLPRPLLSSAVPMISMAFGGSSTAISLTSGQSGANSLACAFHASSIC